MVGGQRDLLVRAAEGLRLRTVNGVRNRARESGEFRREEW